MGMKDWTPAYRRYQKRVVVASLGYAAALVGVVWLFKHAPPPGALGYGLAVLPALPIIGIFAALGLYLREETDEYQRYLIARQIVIGTGLALSICTVWGFIESFMPAHHFEAYWVAVVWFAMFGAARCIPGGR
jgi:hypothetical protein